MGPTEPSHRANGTKIGVQNLVSYQKQSGHDDGVPVPISKVVDGVGTIKSFCQNCWDWSDFHKHHPTPLPMDFLTKWGVFNTRLARPEKGGLRGGAGESIVDIRQGTPFPGPGRGHHGALKRHYLYREESDSSMDKWRAHIREARPQTVSEGGAWTGGALAQGRRLDR